MALENQAELIELAFDEAAFPHNRLAAIGSVMLFDSSRRGKRPWREVWHGQCEEVELSIFSEYINPIEKGKLRKPDFLNGAVLWVKQPQVYLPCRRLTFRTEEVSNSYEFRINIGNKPEDVNGLMEQTVEDLTTYLLTQPDLSPESV